MANQTVRDVLTRIRRLHRQLSTFYDSFAETAEQPRTRAFASYLARHEDVLGSCLDRYLAEGADETLGYWFKFAPALNGELQIDRLQVSPAAEVDDLLAVALTIEERLSRICRDIADRCLDSNVRDLFLNLASQEESEERRSSRGALEADEE